MPIPLLATLGGALVTGLSGSLHCALMCGPLACAGLPEERGARLRAASAWQLGRLAAYLAVGAALGGLGSGVGRVMSHSIQPALPWVMAAGLIGSALEVGRWVRPVPGVARIARALGRLGALLPPTLRAATLGAATPFLPCGLLYGVYLAAVATGSAAVGAALTGTFAAGGAAALAGSQLAGMRRWGTRAWLRRAVLLAAAGVLIWRAAAALQVGDAPPPCH